MFELFFGFFWLLITSIVTFAFLFGTEIDASMIPIILFLGVFWFVGIFVFVRGLIKVIRNFLTDKNGKYYIGKIIKTYPNGSSVNDNPQYDVEITFYIDDECETKTLKETIGFDQNKYPEGSYVKVKYYKNDINIIESIEDENLIPNVLKETKVESVVDDIIEVDGHKYKRID